MPALSPSPQPSPIKGEGVFSTFYERINLLLIPDFRHQHLRKKGRGVSHALFTFI